MTSLRHSLALGRREAYVFLVGTPVFNTGEGEHLVLVGSIPIRLRSPKSGDLLLYGRLMEQRVSLITLGVADLAVSRRFYEALGWRGQEVDETVFFQTGGSGLVLWSRDKLAADSGLHDDAGSSFGGIALAHNVRSAAEVDDVLREAAGAGATITRPAADTFYGGYAGCFRDPDGHVWEIAFNAGFPLAEDGSITIPSFGDSQA